MKDSKGYEPSDYTTGVSNTLNDLEQIKVLRSNKRLTKENYEDDTLHLKGKTQNQYNNELWQYAKERENVEDELGIDLVKFASTFIKEDIYLKDKDGNVCCCDYEVTYNKDKKGWYFVSCLLGKYYLKDYEKTWALTKEELER